MPPGSSRTTSASLTCVLTRSLAAATSARATRSAPPGAGSLCPLASLPHGARLGCAACRLTRSARHTPGDPQLPAAVRSDAGHVLPEQRLEAPLPLHVRFRHHRLLGRSVPAPPTCPDNQPAFEDPAKFVGHPAGSSQRKHHPRAWRRPRRPDGRAGTLEGLLAQLLRPVTAKPSPRRMPSSGRQSP
jgi:hypothetical protein